MFLKKQKFHLDQVMTLKIKCLHKQALTQQEIYIVGESTLAGYRLEGFSHITLQLMQYLLYYKISNLKKEVDFLIIFKNFPVSFVGKIKHLE